jgi:tRNA-dihydrouridine synthase
MAPMVGASDYPFRYFLRKYHGVDLTYTQMLHSKNLVNDKSFRQCHLDLWEAGTTYPHFLPTQLQSLEGLSIPNGPPEKDFSPNIVQLAGHDVDMVVKAATVVLEHANGPLSGIDLNLGCPQGIARKGNYGAFLMEADFNRVCEILTALRRAMPSETAVSAKIRLPVDDEILKERIPRLLATGINFMTVHGRTIYENKTKGGACHVERIALAVKLAHEIDPNFPVIANGGMETYEDVQEILQSTGAVAAMSSEALLETPNIFKQSSAHLTPRELLDQQFSFAWDYLDVCAEVAPPLPGSLGGANVGSCTVMRGHLIKFLHRYLQQQPDMRDGMSGRDAVKNIVQVRAWVDELYGRYDRMSEEELNACEASSPQSSWYLRHRKPERRVHQKAVLVASDLTPGGTEEQESVEDRKREIQKRIARLQEQKKEKKESKAFV